jgi:hypothetical protein
MPDYLWKAEGEGLGTPNLGPTDLYEGLLQKRAK